MQDEIKVGIDNLKERVAAVEISTRALETSIDKRISDLVGEFKDLVAQFGTFNTNLSTMLKHLLEKDGRYERFVVKVLAILTVIWGLKEIAIGLHK